MIREDISRIIYNLRIENGYTQQELASLLYVGRETVSKWERGISVPDIVTFLSLCNVCNTSFEDVFKNY